MTTRDRPAARLPLCADVSRATGEDPIGTAPHWQELTVLELGVPVWDRLRQPDCWTGPQRDVFGDLRGKVEASGAGFGLLMTAPGERRGPLRVRHYTRSAGGFTRRDYASDLPQGEWARGLHDTLLEPGNLRSWEEFPAPGGPDLDVCTHGTVDAACGKYGVPVFQALRSAGTRAWRTGPFGGHRFAATAVELPAGLLWAHLTPERAVRVARRDLPPSEVARNLRGFAGLLRRGWSWLEARRTAEVRGRRVTLRYELNGVHGVASATVGDAPALTLPGSSHTAERTDVRQYRLSELTDEAAP